MVSSSLYASVFDFQSVRPLSRHDLHSLLRRRIVWVSCSKKFWLFVPRNCQVNPYFWKWCTFRCLGFSEGDPWLSGPTKIFGKIWAHALPCWFIDRSCGGETLRVHPLFSASFPIVLSVGKAKARHLVTFLP